MLGTVLRCGGYGGDKNRASSFPQGIYNQMGTPTLRSIPWRPHVQPYTVLLSLAAGPHLPSTSLSVSRSGLFGSSKFTLSPMRSWCHPTCPETQIRENTHSQFNWQLNSLPHVISVKTTHNYYRACVPSRGSTFTESDNYWALIS